MNYTMQMYLGCEVLSLLFMFLSTKYKNKLSIKSKQNSKTIRLENLFFIGREENVEKFVVKLLFLQCFSVSNKACFECILRNTNFIIVTFPSF